MALVNRLLDAFFRTLDAVDSARDRLDRVLGRTPEPIASDWPADPTRPSEPFAQPAPKHAPPWPAEKAAPARPGKQAEQKAERAGERGAPAAPAKAARAAKKQPGKVGRPAKKKGARKGSVDRTGADFDSARARAVADRIRADNRPILSEDALLDGKKVLARVVWALEAAHQAGSEQGLTAADASALLHLIAGMEVFSTNIARACREETDLIAEGEPDGRIKRYRLTPKGRAAAASLATG